MLNNIFQQSPAILCQESDQIRSQKVRGSAGCTELLRAGSTSGWDVETMEGLLVYYRNVLWMYKLLWQYFFLICDI